VHDALELGAGNRRIALGADHPLLRPPGPGQQFLIHISHRSRMSVSPGARPVTALAPHG
jgi:hypothetical protein